MTAFDTVKNAGLNFYQYNIIYQPTPFFKLLRYKDQNIFLKMNHIKKANL